MPTPLYHGTVAAGLAEVLPAAASGRRPVHGETDPAYAYATPELDDAWHYAELAWHGSSHGVPRVYRVAALGPVEADPAHDGFGRSRGNHTADLRCRHGFAVMEEIEVDDPEEWA